MRVIKTKEGSLFIETNKRPDEVTDHTGMKYYYVQTPPIDEIVRTLPTPLLEDIWHEANNQLLMRDKQWVDNHVDKLTEGL